MIRGIEAFGARLGARMRQIQARAGEEVLACARECADMARDMAPEGAPPRDEPRLKDSFSAVGEGTVARAVVSNPHAAYVEFGTGRRGAESGKFAGGYDAEWAGMRAQPYMYPAAQAMKEEFARRMARIAGEMGGR